MNILYKDLDLCIPLAEGLVTTIVIEDKKVYRNLARGLVDQCNGDEGDWIIEDDMSFLNFKKFVFPILNNWYIDINEKNILTKLNSLATHLIEDELELLNEINQKIQMLFAKIDQQLPIEVNHNDVLLPQDLVKVSGFSILQDCTDIIGTLVSYIELLNEFLGIRVFVLFNIRSVVEKEELKLIYNTLVNKKITLICLESGDANLIEKSEQEEIYTLDKDFCII